MNLILIIFLILFISHSVFLIIVINNLVNAPRVSDFNINAKSDRSISILIPARNEEKNIGSLLDSLLKQSYKKFEILVLDDNSSDNTFNVVKRYTERFDRVKLFNGDPLPQGWLGKNWACKQLADKAATDTLLFIDADVFISENGLANSLKLFDDNDLNMFSVFPTQKLRSFGELLIVPLMNWLLLTFLPLKKVFTSRSKSFTAANGQFILINKNDYYDIGTHQKVKDKVVEDMELARLLKKKNKRVMTALGDEAIVCNMYFSFISAFYGFTKNFYSGFNTSKFTFIVLMVILLLLFLVPFLLVFMNSIFLIIVIIIIIERIFVSVVSRQNWILNVILHPLQMIVMFVVGLNSTLNKNIKWKNREI